MTSLPPKRRPTGANHEVTDELVASLTKLLETHKEEEIAAALAAYLEHPVDRSSINNILTRRYPTSRLAYPLAVLYGWPIPPVARAEPKLARLQAMLDELARLDPERFHQVQVIVESEVETARAKLALTRKKERES